MAVKTCGSLATTTFHAIQGNPSVGAISAADMATTALAINYDPYAGAQGNVAKTIWPGAFSWNGILYVPGRGQLTLQPGDWVCYDTAGFPYLIPNKSMPTTLVVNGNTHTSTTIDTFASSIITAGWQVGTPVTGSGVPANAYITAIAKNGLSCTISAATTTTVTNTGITAGCWTHS